MWPCSTKSNSGLNPRMETLRGPHGKCPDGNGFTVFINVERVTESLKVTALKALLEGQQGGSAGKGPYLPA